MNTVLLSPQSVKQINPISIEYNHESNYKEDKDNYYFHGCRKDANCDCKMCLDSITATLDLMSMSVQRSSLTKLSASKPVVKKSPVSIDPALLSTPTSKRSSPVVEVGSSKLDFCSTEKTGVLKNVEVKKRKIGCKFKFWKWVLFLGLILGFEFRFSWGVVRVLRPRLSEEILRGVVEEFSNVENFSERLSLIEKSLNNSVHGELSSCIIGDSTWRINQDSLILISCCNLYKSMAEEVFICGWPLQTAGVFTAGFSSRSFNVLWGKITEWPDGKIKYVVREENSTWMLRKWSASVVQFESNTWIIEYRRSSLLENPSVLRAAVEFVKLRILKFMERMKQHVWLLRKFKYYNTSTSEVAGLDIPT